MLLDPKIGNDIIYYELGKDEFRQRTEYKERAPATSTPFQRGFRTALRHHSSRKPHGDGEVNCRLQIAIPVNHSNFVFVPVRFVCGFFSMNGDFAVGESKLWVYFVVVVPLTLIILGLGS